MRIAWEWPLLLVEDGTKTPKYLQKMIDTEIKNQLEWSRAHQPVRIDIDLSQLSGIRSAAAQTREALLIEEERGDATASGSAQLESAASVAGLDVPSTAVPAPPRTSEPASPPRGILNRRHRKNLKAWPSMRTRSRGPRRPGRPQRCRVGRSRQSKHPTCDLYWIRLAPRSGGHI